MAILTPILGNKRVRMSVSQADQDKVTRGRGYKGIVTDKKTGKRYKIWGRPCNLPGCYCDATAHSAK